MAVSSVVTAPVSATPSTFNRAVDWTKQTAQSVWTSVSNFFTNVAHKIGEWLDKAKGATIAGYATLREKFNTLPKEGKIATVLGAGAALALMVWGCFKCCKTEKKEEEETSSKSAETQVDSSAKKVVTTTESTGSDSASKSSGAPADSQQLKQSDAPKEVEIT